MERIFFNYFEKLIIRTIDDSLIEKILLFFIIDNDYLNENDKQMIKILIENDKKIHFIRVRYLFIVVFLTFYGYFVDDVEDQFILRISTAGIIYYSRPVMAKSYRKYEKKTMINLESKILKLFNKNAKYIITKNIETNRNYEKYNDDDDGTNMVIQNIYLSIYNNILIVYEYYTKLLKEIFDFICGLIFICIRPFIFKTKYGIKRNIINIILSISLVQYVIGFNNTTGSNKYKGNRQNEKEEEHKLKNNILYFFKNINIIIENNTIDKELKNLLNQLLQLTNNKEFLNKYVFMATENKFVKRVINYKVVSTVTCLIINETSLTQLLSMVKTRCLYYVESKYCFFKKLPITHDFIDILNEKPYQVAKTIPWINNGPVDPLDHRVENIFVLENLTLEYESKGGHKNIVLENVNLKFEIGKSHFIYGNSGCGKTTLLSALMKRIKIFSGVIKFLGIYDEYTYFSIRRYLTYITSESALFYKDLYYNIIYGIDEKVIMERGIEVMETITKYMNLFGLDKYIPTMKTTNAHKISKGQAQRVAIIRLFMGIIFNDTRILFLDEFTSNIDNKMEKLIYTELRTLQKNPKYNFTIFYVSHNLYNIKYSDYNYEIDTERHSIEQNITNINQVQLS